MDLLSQYKQDHPEAFQEKKPVRMTDEYGREYTGMVAFVIRLSGGRIKDARQAIYVLVSVVGVVIILTTGIYVFSSGSQGESLESKFHSGSSVFEK